PLTLPIYETTTFVFENAEQVKAYNEGRSQRFLYSRYSNPTIVAVEQTIAGLERAESAMLLSSGMAATATALLALLKSGDEIICIIDNTFASPVNQQPIGLGVDVVMHSVTKYLNGHSDVTAGALAGPRTLIQQIDKTRKMLGTVIDPQAAYAIGRGVKTLAVRMERHNSNGLAIARWLERDSRVTKVYYPGLESHPDHALAARQMRGFGGMVC